MTTYEKMNSSVKFNQATHLWEGPGAKDAYHPFAALSTKNQKKASKFWEKWHKRPDSGKAKARSDLASTPPMP